jgi:Ca2+/H+ antiporter
MLAVINALLLHILLSALIATICNSWTDQILPGLSGRIIGPIIVAGFSLVGEALKISTISSAGDASHFIVGGLSAQVFSFGVGLGLPWLISGFTGGNCALNFPTIRNQLNVSMVCACTLMIYCIGNLDNEKTVHFNRGSSLLLVYVIVVLVFIFSQ